MSLTAPPSNLDDLHLRNESEMMKSEHTSSPGSTNSDSADKKDADKWIWVLDPMTRKLRVPLNLLAPTQATATPGTVPSLCIAYLEGRCRHPWCRQAHVLPSAIPQLRYEALNAPTCCHTHNDPHDITPLTTRFRNLRVTNNGSNGTSELIPTDRVASTVGLLRFLVHNAPKKDENGTDSYPQAPTRVTESGAAASGKSDSERTLPPADPVLDVPAKYICRLHLAHRCRYLEDCNNIHICREYELQLQPPPHTLSALAAVTASARTVTVGDVYYTVTPLALNEVTDDEFQSITDTQKKAHALAACDGGADGTPMLFPDKSPMSNPKFPALPDPWAQGKRTPSLIPASNINNAPSSTFRVYDVRGVSTSKVATPAFSGRRGDSTPNSFGALYGVDGGLPPPPPPPHYANNRSHRDPHGQ